MIKRFMQLVQERILRGVFGFAGDENWCGGEILHTLLPMNQRELHALNFLLELAESSEDAVVRQAAELLRNVYRKEFFLDTLQLAVRISVAFFALATVFFFPEFLNRAVRMYCAQ